MSNSTLPSVLEVKNRNQMVNFFNELMASTYTRLKEEQELGYGENLVKTYILENHESNIDDFLNTLKEKINLKHSDTSDPTLKLLQYENGEFFLDSFDNRFLLVHSPSDSDICNNFFKSITSFAQIDRAWLSSQFLEKITEFGIFESWSSKFNSKIVYRKSDLEVEDIDWEHLSLTIRTRPSKTKEMYKKIKESKIFEGFSPITGIRMKTLNPDDQNLFTRSDITTIGKITARGNYFEGHIQFATGLMRAYKKLILMIENEFGFGIKKRESRYELKGAVVNIVMPEEKIIEPFKPIVESWFNSTKPFMLWGIIDYEGNDYAIVNAVDLHIGSQISFEISPKFIRIYLPNGSCGNSVIRFITNLQQHFNSAITIDNRRINDFFREELSID